jgi:hypothetical protein
MNERSTKVNSLCTYHCSWVRGGNRSWWVVAEELCVTWLVGPVHVVGLDAGKRRYTSYALAIPSSFPRHSALKYNKTVTELRGRGWEDHGHWPVPRTIYYVWRLLIDQCFSVSVDRCERHIRMCNFVGVLGKSKAYDRTCFSAFSCCSSWSIVFSCF